MTPSVDWLLLYTKPRAEVWAEKQLRRCGVTTLLPRVQSRRELVPLFPRYVLATATSEALATLPGPVGVLYVVPRGDDAPALVPADVVRAVRARMDRRGIVRLDAEPSPDSLFTPSHRARVRALLRVAGASALVAHGPLTPRTVVEHEH